MNAREAHEYLRTAEAAEYLRLSVSKLAKWRITGEGPPFARLGGVVVYPRSELQRFVENAIVKAQSNE